MDAEELKLRTKQFAIDVARLNQSLTENRVNNAYCNQIVRSASSTGANYRAARRAKIKGRSYQ
ncbi:four helix bundle protein [Niabella yanshanensis]|uniref:four helix bundle protein n=1 Tax=Niabella yanshanensis TaxID=577386 RepID=UPI001B85CFFC